MPAHLSLSKDTPPSCSRTIEAGTVCVSPARPFTLPTFCGGLVNRDMTLPAADQTRNNVTRRDSTRPSPSTPRACLRRITNLQHAHLFPSCEWCELIEFHGNPGSSSFVNFSIVALFQIDLEVTCTFRTRRRLLHAPAHSSRHRSGLIIFLNFGDEGFSCQHQPGD